jgi:hypothetical protein
MVDVQIIPYHYGIEDMGIILRTIGQDVFNDIMAEESESLPEVFDTKAIRKAVGSKLPFIVKEIIANKEPVNVS